MICQRFRGHEYTILPINLSREYIGAYCLFGAFAFRLSDSATAISEGKNVHPPPHTEQRDGKHCNAAASCMTSAYGVVVLCGLRPSFLSIGNVNLATSIQTLIQHANECDHAWESHKKTKMSQMKLVCLK